jgi:hypothetical protein
VIDACRKVSARIAEEAGCRKERNSADNGNIY